MAMANVDRRRTARYFVLGAGFSAPAGLPLSTDLLALVLNELDRVDNSGHLRAALDEYRAFRLETGGPDGADDIEDFAAFMDYEHFLSLLGSDGWSAEGNRSQLQLRWGIGRVLHRSTPQADRLPAAFLSFAQRVAPPDIVVTFNYDRLLEAAFEHVGTPYRRFPFPQRVDETFGLVVDIAREAGEVLLLKVHGSVDWVSTGTLSKRLEEYRRSHQDDVAEFTLEHDPLFGSEPISITHPLVEGPSYGGDPLLDLHVIEDLDAYYSEPRVLYDHAPLILAPSSAKLLYGAPLVPLWGGMDAYLASGLSIIGYSLPQADPYARQAIFRLVRSYVRYLDTDRDHVSPPRPMELVTLKRTTEARREFRDVYRFMPEARTVYVTDGFNERAVEVLFSE